jgi:hypothetical protein
LRLRESRASKAEQAEQKRKEKREERGDRIKNERKIDTSATVNVYIYTLL